MKTATLAASLALAACAHSPGATDVPASLAAAESAFAAHSVREDMRAAFLAAFADDGVMVRNGWTVSNAFLANRPAPPIVLEWRPQYVEVAASGDLGLSTGPSRITSKQMPETPPSHGQFVSIWRRAPGGPWKVEVDLGISHAEPFLWNEPLQLRTVPAVAGNGESLDKAEADFQRRVASGTRAAYEARGARDLRLFRGGAAPSAVAALSSPPLPERALAWTVERSVTAASDDFGYTRGAYADVARPAEALGWYLRVWRREAGGWRVFVDVVNPAAPRG
jgi:ketosteroid isomerase-like protein